MAGAWQMWLSLYAIFVVAALACLPMEWANRQPWLSYIRGAAYWAIFLGVYTMAMVIAQAALRAAGMRPMLVVDLSSVAAGSALHFLVAIGLALVPAFLFDFAYYWFHRLQHATPLLWRFHAVHHAIEELNAVNCSHHWTEGLVRVALISVPVILLIDLRVPEIVAMTIILGAWGQVVHTNAPIGFGVLSATIVSPRFHRVHHSLDPRHHHKNFAGVFPVIDVLFGTAHFPKADEAIRTGLADRGEARTLIDYITARRVNEPTAVVSITTGEERKK